MADYTDSKKISQLDSASPISGSDIAPIYQSSAGKAVGATLDKLSTYFKGTVSFDVGSGFEEVSAATYQDVDCAYNNSAGTLSANEDGAFTLPNYTPALNDRILVWKQTNAIQNGIYVISTLGDGSTAYVLTRATDCPNLSEFTAYPVSCNDGDYKNNTWLLTGTISITSVTVNTFIVNNSTHNDLSGLNVDDYQHLSAAEKALLTTGIDAGSTHMHSDYVSFDESITGGLDFRYSKVIAGSDRYARIDLPLVQDEFQSDVDTTLDVTIIGYSSSSYTTLSAPVRMRINVRRSDASNAIISSIYYGSTKIENVLLYVYAGGDSIYLDLNNYYTYKVIVNRYYGFDTRLEYTSLSLATSATLVGTLAASVAPFEIITNKSEIALESLSSAGFIPLDANGLSRKTFKLGTSELEVYIDIGNYVSGGEYLFKITKLTASNILIGRSDELDMFKSGDYYDDATDGITLSGPVDAEFIIKIIIIGSYKYYSLL